MLYKYAQGYPDRGVDMDLGNVFVSANLQLFQGFGHEFWLGELRNLQENKRTFLVVSLCFVEKRKQICKSGLHQAAVWWR